MAEKLQTAAPQQTITIGNKVYEVEKLTDRVKRLISVFQMWTQEAEKQQLELAKTQAALRDLTREIIAAQAEEEGLTDKVEVTDKAA